MAEGWRKHEAEMPRLFGTDGVPFQDKEIWLHYFVIDTDSHWMAAETDGDGSYYGYVVLNGDYEKAGWGIFRLVQLMMTPGMMIMRRKVLRRFADVLREVRSG